MTTFTPKGYQLQLLETLETYFQACYAQPSPSLAFSVTTERLWGQTLSYHPLSGFPSDMPYFCLRVPRTDPSSCDCSTTRRCWTTPGIFRSTMRRQLQKADGRFYPDFLARLPGSEDAPGPTLAVEYKGADRWKASEDDRLIGGLWAGLLEGRCRFVMVKDKRWDWIDPLLS